MYTIVLRVLCSVRGGRGEVVSDGGVFWWRGECEGVLSAVWDDLVLLLHTLEEKQVRGAVTAPVSQCPQLTSPPPSLRAGPHREAGQEPHEEHCAGHQHIHRR